MNTLVPALAAIQASEEHSLVRVMIDAIPTDPASLVVLALVVGAGVAVVMYGRKGGPEEGRKQ
jgi:hypothetical protein